MAERRYDNSVAICTSSENSNSYQTTGTNAQILALHRITVDGMNQKTVSEPTCETFMKSFWLCKDSGTVHFNVRTTVRLVESNSNPDGYQLVNTYMTNRNADPMDLVQLAQQIQKADEFVKATAGSKLVVIADQIRYLQEQARKVLEEAKRDNMLHHAACNMVKKPGQIYYLYKRESGQHYFSILSPQEWGSCPHEFIGSFRLEHDMSWTPVAKIEEKNDELGLVNKILNAQKAITDSSEPNIKGLIQDSESKDRL